MAITITAAGTYTVIPGETYIIGPTASGTVNFVSASGTGSAGFTVAVNQTMTNTVTVNLNAASGSLTLNPTISIADGVNATRLDVNTNASNNFGSLTYNIGTGASIGDIESANGSSASAVKTTITAGDNTTISSIEGGSAATTATLGDNVTVTNGIVGATGGFTMTTGDSFSYDGGAMDFDDADGDVSIAIGNDSTLNGENVDMGASDVDYAFSIGENSDAGTLNMGGSNGNHTVNVGNGTTVGHILMGGSGAGIEQTVILGENVNTGDISIGGSGTAADHMTITLTAGDGTNIGGTPGASGNIGLGGSQVDRTVTFGDNVIVEGLLGMGGSAGTNVVTIGDNYTQGDYFTGSTSGSDTVTIGNDWRFGSTFTLQGGNDSLTIGSTTRDSSGTISGGDGADALTIIIAQENATAFQTAATNAGWTQNPDGSWATNGRPLTWQSITYSSWETAQAIPCFTRGTMIRCDGAERRIEDLRIGDLVWTRDNGLQPIRWIGSRMLDAATLQHAEKLRPIRISKGALGPDTPDQDLVVSPQHRILVRSRIAQRVFGASEVLVAAKQLLQIDGIDIAGNLAEVEYFHMLFDRHEVVLSNGAETESLYTGPEALKSIGRPALEEVYAVFPMLRDPAHVPAGARILASGRQGRKLAARHLHNGKPLVMQGPAAA